MRMLLLGGTGQVGTELRALRGARTIELVAPARSKANLTDANALSDLIGQANWDVVVNAAAYTAVDRAEHEEQLAFAVNGEGPSRLAIETGRRNIPLVHISTDYVFDGGTGAAYVESDRTAPLNVYGRSKLRGEIGVREGNRRHVIVRTAWVYSPFGSNFVKTILRLADERARLTIVADQRGCPTAARDIARVCLDIASHCAAEPASAPYGTYHFAGGGEASWYEFAKTIVELAGPRLGKSPEVVAIGSADYPTPAARPADTRLDCTSIAKIFGIRPRPWREALVETIDRLFSNKGAS
jgi:dTDP-4-dehydrorhamnose reductase